MPLHRNGVDMPRHALGPRLYLDPKRGSYVIRHGRRFIRTGARGWKLAGEILNEYCRERALKPAQSKPKKKGIIYFITADVPDYPIKIGFTERLTADRMTDLQCGCPFRLVVLAAVEGTFQEEQGLHRDLDEYRMSGEWFRRSDLLMEVIRQANEEKAQ